MKIQFIFIAIIVLGINSCGPQSGKPNSKESPLLFLKKTKIDALSGTLYQIRIYLKGKSIIIGGIFGFQR